LGQHAQVSTKSVGLRLRTSSDIDFRAAVLEAVEGGRDGEHELVAVLDEVSRDRKVMITAALGDCQGPAGRAALRSVLKASGPHSQDLCCAALLALAKRCGADATTDFAFGLSSRLAVVKGYAMIGLAGAGDGRAWDPAFDRLRVLLRRPSLYREERAVPRSFMATAVVWNVAYLAQHLEADEDRPQRLVGQLWRRWHQMNNEEYAWLDEFWPDVSSERPWPALSPDSPLPASIGLPDPRRIRAWARDPLFDRPALPRLPRR
jgi:hypothetical protein